MSYDLLREEAIKKARSLDIHRSRFKVSKGMGHKVHAPDWAGVAA